MFATHRNFHGGNVPYLLQTLAVGVNLREPGPTLLKGPSRLLIPPSAAHIVVIKDVRIFQNGVSQEYSDLDIMQMIGRAVSHISVNLHARLNERHCYLTRGDPNSVRLFFHCSNLPTNETK